MAPTDPGIDQNVRGTGGRFVDTLLAVALSLRDAYPDGVVFVDLSALNDAALVAPAVAQALGLREEGALGVHELLVAHLRNKRLLLALDNVEQIIEAASSIADLVAACPLLAMLSRCP